MLKCPSPEFTLRVGTTPQAFNHEPQGVPMTLSHRKCIRVQGDPTDQLEQMIREIHRLRCEKNRLTALIIESRGRTPLYRERLAIQLGCVDHKIKRIERGAL